jgi:hypothetical protein
MSFTNSAIIADVLAVINSEFGPINPALQPNQIAAFTNARMQLAVCIAEAGIFTRDNATVTVVGVGLNATPPNTAEGALS